MSTRYGNLVVEKREKFHSLQNHSKTPPFRRQVGIGTLARRGGRAGYMDVLAITDFS